MHSYTDINVTTSQADFYVVCGIDTLDAGERHKKLLCVTGLIGPALHNPMAHRPGAETDARRARARFKHYQGFKSYGLTAFASTVDRAALEARAYPVLIVPGFVGYINDDGSPCVVQMRKATLAAALNPLGYYALPYWAQHREPLLANRPPTLFMRKTDMEQLGWAAMGRPAALRKRYVQDETGSLAINPILIPDNYPRELLPKD